METTGTLQRVLQTADALIVEFAIPKTNKDALNNLAGEQLDIKAVKHRQKRSLSANAYFHVICGKIADALGVSMTEAKNKLIAEWGAYDADENGNISHVILRDDINYLLIEWAHLTPTTKTRVMDNGQLYRVYIVMRGSHTYDTKEMSRLIDGAVGAAKDLGIETLPPHELERMKAMWKGEC